MALIDKDQLKKFKEALEAIIVSSQGLTYDACKDVAEKEATFLISMLIQEPNIQSSNIKETIRAEIERRLSNIVTGLDFTAEIELKGLLSFLDSIPPIQSLNRDHIDRIIELWQDVEHDVEWCNEPSEFLYDEVLRRFNLDTLPEQPASEGLEEEIEFYLDHAELATKCKGISAAEDYFNDLKATARHFYELGKNARNE